MTGWLNFARNPSATSRADRSVIPAGGNGTIMRIGREGNGWAEAAVDSSTQASNVRMMRTFPLPPLRAVLPLVMREGYCFGRRSRPTLLFTNCSVYDRAKANDGFTTPARTILS